MNETGFRPQVKKSIKVPMDGGADERLLFPRPPLFQEPADKITILKTWINREPGGAEDAVHREPGAISTHLRYTAIR